MEKKENNKRLEQQFDFIREIDREKLIGRQTYLTDGSRKENDAEHAWHLALMTILLGEYAKEPIDVLKTVTMVLLHDIVEIDAGDTYAYDDEAKKTQQERELKAADRIFNLLPKEQAEKLRGLWDEFEACATPEAKFARTMDNIQPAVLTAAEGGKAWREKNVLLSKILERNRITPEGSDVLWQYMKENLLKPYVKTGTIREDAKMD